MVDWWSMGVIMFECLVGYAPFHANDPLATCRKIVRYQRYFKVPGDIKLTKQAQDLMKVLVCPAHRRIGWEKIKAHPWFKKVNWNDLKSHKPPFVAELKNPWDSKHFEDDIEQEFDDTVSGSKEADKANQSGWSSSAANNNKVVGYTFTRAQGQDIKAKLKAAKNKQ